MIPASRTLVWLLCALLLGLGLPRLPAACGEAMGPGNGCCAKVTCCCGEHDQDAACPCDHEGQPVPAPQSPAPKPVPLLAADRQKPRVEPVPAPEPAKVRAATAASLPPGTLPLRRRQEVLAVWRL